MTGACTHPITQGRKDDPTGGSWCVDCGAKVVAVHDRPCVECRHHKRLPGGSICKHHLMAIWSGMHVTYWVEPGPGHPGLCFKALDVPCDSRARSA